MYTNSHDNNILKGYNMLLYFAGSMIMYEPSEECIEDFWTQGILKNLPVSSSNPNFIKAASQLRESCVEKHLCGKMMREDHYRLFTRQDLALAPAYESFYMKNVDTSLHHHIDNVAKFYNSYGWESKFRGKINDDHLGIELLFLTILIEKYMVLEDDACRIEMRGEIRRFIKQHILSWVALWHESIQRHAKTLCYKGISTLIYACVEDLYRVLGENAGTSDQRINLKN
jgi:TorA maturation chaperone TorD